MKSMRAMQQLQPKMQYIQDKYKDNPQLMQTKMMEIIKRDYADWEKTIGSSHRELSHAEKLNRDYFRGRFASLVDGRHIFNWEEVSLVDMQLGKWEGKFFAYLILNQLENSPKRRT